MPASLDIEALHKHHLTRTACPYPEGFLQCDLGTSDKACESGRPGGDNQRGHSYHCAECKFDVCLSCAVVALGKVMWPLSLHGAISKHCSAEGTMNLLSARPEAAGEKDKHGRLALHLACEKNAAADVVAAVLAANPEAAWEKDDKSHYPLHSAALANQSHQVIAALLLAYPQAVGQRSNIDRLPLHCAAAGRAPLPVLSALIDAHPAACRETDKNGMLPLHWALESNLPDDRSASLKGAVDALLAVNPDAVSSVGENGKLALHVAASKSAPLAVIEALLSCHPSAAQAEDDLGMLALHYALENEAPLSTVEALLKAYPGAVRIKGEEGKLPLHFAAENKASSDVIDTLLLVFPEASREKDKEWNVPLHHAAKSRAPLAVIQALLKAFPEGCKAHRLGPTPLPLHLAAANHGSPDVIAALLLAYPEASRHQDGGRNFPLHHASDSTAPNLAVIRLLLEAAPESAREKGKHDMLPLHMAVANIRAPSDVIMALLSAYPEGCRERDAYGRLPLHYYSPKMAPKDLLSALLAAHPDSIREKDKNEKLALHYFIKTGGPENEDIYKTILQSDLPVQLDAAATPRTHGFNWTAFIDTTKDRPSLSKVVVEGVLRLLPSQRHCLALALAADESGRSAISIAHQDVQRLLNSYIFFCGRYEMSSGPNLHKSATSCVICATDHGRGVDFDKTQDKAAKPPLLAIKFMRNEEQYQREVTVRKGSQLDGEYVVGLLEAPDPEVFAEQVKGLSMHDGRSLADYKFGLVMPFADRSLDDIVNKERPDLQQIRAMMKHVALAVKHCHDRGVLHGDLKMLNCVRVEGKIKLIDMDASALIGRDCACAKFSSGVLPPELFYRLRGAEEEQRHAAYFQAAAAGEGQEEGEEWAKVRPVEGVVVRAYLPGKADDDNADLPYALVPASAAADVWSYGAMLFHMCTGEPLLPVNRDTDLVDGAAMRQALGWSDEQLRRKVGNASMPGDALQARLVKDLLKLVLRPDPAQRVSLQSVLEHPFFTGQVPSRLSAEASVQWDVFISYRVDSDAALAVQMHDKLTARGLRVYLDTKCLVPGVDWEVGFCDGLLASRCFVPLISRKAIEERFRDLGESSHCDNVLLEYRLAMELQRRGMVERIFPLFVGDADAAGGARSKYYPSRSASACSVRAVEDKLAMHLERQGLGVPLEERPSVAHILSRVTAFQGGFIEGLLGSLEGALGVQADNIRDMVRAQEGGGAAPLKRKPAGVVDGETDLDLLLLSLRPVIVPGRFVYVNSPVRGEAASPGVEVEADVYAAVREAEGTSLVVTKDHADAAGLAYDAAFVACWITLEVHSSLAAVGLTAAVSQALTREGISCNVIAGRFHDHLLVPEDRAGDAMRALERLSQEHRA